MNAAPTGKISTLAKDLNLGEVVEVRRIKWGNDIDYIATSMGTFFCKTYTKHWYGPPEQNSGPVLHEAGAYATLKANGLATPEVVRAEPSSGNPLGRPYLLLRALEGETIGRRFTNGNDVTPLLTAAGRYLKQMHGIVFRYSGYVYSPQGPTSPPDPSQGRHYHWAADALEQAVKTNWERVGGELSSEFRADLQHLFESNRGKLAAGYQPPRMMHGDCHMDQFFFHDNAVTGVVDMEVASSGAPIGDLVKFSIEASSRLSGINWWEPFFNGYGEVPDFGIFKLRLLCCEYAEFECQNWKGSYAEILNRLWAARSWPDLFGGSGR